MPVPTPLLRRDIQERISGVIEKSFDTRPMPSGNITQAEVNRRVNTAKDVFTTLFNDCHWTSERILDHLPVFLARFLDGEEAIPEWAKRTIGDDEHIMWGAESAGRVEPENRLSALSQSTPLLIGEDLEEKSNGN